MAAAIPVYVAIAQGVAQSVAAKKQAAAQRKAAQLQTTATTQAATIGQQSNTDMINFLKQQEDQRRADAEKTQTLNFQQFQEDLARR